VPALVFAGRVITSGPLVFPAMIPLLAIVS
jgi:hypothetical protein